MKSKKVITILDSIPKCNPYSHYGVCLDKIFKKNSLKNFIETLKFHEEYRRKFLDKGGFLMPTYAEDKEKQLNEDEDKNDLISSKKFLKKNQESANDIFSIDYIPKSTKIQGFAKTKNYSTFFHPKNSAKKKDTPDAFKYSPKYNAILKNVPYVKMYQPVSFIKQKKKINLENLKKFNDVPKTDKPMPKIKNNNNNNEGHKIAPSLITELDLFENKIYKSITQNKTTNEKFNKKTIHQFSDSSKSSKKNKKIRKSKLPTSLIELNSQKSEISYPLTNRKMSKNDIKEKLSKLKNKNPSFYHRNKAIDFSKMKSHSYRNLFNKKSLTALDAGIYNPKYDFIEQSTRNIFINKRPIDKFKIKKLKLNQILTSYNTEVKYGIIDNTKLNDEILKEYNI